MAKAKTDESESLFNSENLWIAAAVALVVLCVVKGCRSKSVPAGPPLATMGAADDAPPASPREKTTAVAYVSDSYRCIACDWLKSDVDWLQQKHGWDGYWSFQTDNRGQVPRIEFYRGGVLVGEIVGYSESSRWEERKPILKAIVDRMR